uniref:Putative salivary lipocalin n=1 Tax=Ixodes ricinus TaxID=34613 RepID=A0A6B0UQL3_IXORI
MTMWLLFFFLSTTVDATTNPPWNKSEYETMQNLTNIMDLYLTLKKDDGYDVYNYMNLEDAEEAEDLGAMHLVYTDYTVCSLFYYDKTGDYELWLYNKPDEVASPCELLLALLWDKSTHVYYTKNCTDIK